MDSAARFLTNPLLTPAMIMPSRPDLTVECILNPGVFRFAGKTWLLVRVAERPKQQQGRVSFPVMENGQIKILDFDASDPLLDTSDSREFKYNGEGYLSTMSHLRLLCSDDGIHFSDTGRSLFGEGDLESFGIEDCRVATMPDGEFILTYTAVSNNGYGIGLRTTRDWKIFEHYGMVITPANKDCAVFEEKINGRYVCLNRPSSIIVGGHYMWLSESPDLRFWGNHRCIAKTRAGMWDSARIGCGAAPVKTEKGWLEIYHGSDGARYCLGAMLLDLNNPSRVLARSETPLMEPLTEYEKTGFFGEVIFSNGQLVNGDELTVYYGAADSVICGARFSIQQILETLG